MASVVQLRTQNHRSLRDEQIISLVAASEGQPGLIILTRGLSESLLPVAAIYGANASGKSNVLDALAFMAKTVAFSQTVWQPDSGIPDSRTCWAPTEAGPRCSRSK